MILNRIHKGKGNRPKPPADHPIITTLKNPTYQDDVYTFALKQTKLLKSNVCYILEVQNMPINNFFKLLNDSGCKLSMSGWIKGTRNTLLNSYVIHTMAYVLKVDYNTLFAEDITTAYTEPNATK